MTVLATIVAGLILAAASSLTALAYNKPIIYKRLLHMLAIGFGSAYSLLLLWDIFLYCAKTQLVRSISIEYANAANNALSEMEVPPLSISVIFWGTFLFLALLTQISKLRGDKDDNLPE